MGMKITLDDGTVVQGEFDDDRFLKNGKRSYADGEIHEGEFNILGKLAERKKTFPDGVIQEGKFEFSRVYGEYKFKKGEITHPDGRVELVDES